MISFKIYVPDHQSLISLILGEGAYARVRLFNQDRTKLAAGMNWKGTEHKS